MLSAVVLTKNEEKNIKECLKSLSWCGEIVVVDDCSQDKTAQIAKKMGVRVFVRDLNDNYAQQRNFGLGKAKGDWVLFVDADERVTKALALEIKSCLGEVEPGPDSVGTKRPRSFGAFPSGFDLKGFYIKRKDFIFGRWLKYGETGKIKLLRLAKKDAGRWEKPVHEVWKIKGRTGELKNPLLHYPHPTASQFLEKINQYSTIRARELYCQGKRTNFFEIIAFPMGKFLKNFIWNLGFLDGLPGFLHAIFMSFHSFLVRGKLWLLRQKFDKIACDRM